MNKKLVALSTLAALIMPMMAVAAINLPALPAFSSINLNTVINNVFNIVWIFTAAAIVILFVVIGFMFLTAEGDPAKVALARRAVIWGAVGVVVILLSFSIIALVVQVLEPVGDGSSGSACTEDTDCDSDFCVDDRCT